MPVHARLPSVGSVRDQMASESGPVGVHAVSLDSTLSLAEVFGCSSMLTSGPVESIGVVRHPEGPPTVTLSATLCICGAELESATWIVTVPVANGATVPSIAVAPFGKVTSGLMLEMVTVAPVSG